MTNGRRLAAILLTLALTLVACTSADQDETASSVTAPTTPDSLGDTSTDHENAENIEYAGENDDEPLDGANQVVLTEAEGISEEPAEEPVIEASEPVEIEFEDSADAPQANVGVSESALCASLQIGRDAAVDGDGELAAAQRDLIIERAPSLADGQLATILAGLVADETLDVSIVENGLARCQTLGFEV